MELRHLRYFVTLAETLHFTRAAERVHVTQSTLSHQIKQLEDEVGQALFNRVGRRVVLTESGELFLGFASKALKEVDVGMGALKRSSTEMTGVVRIGATHGFNIAFVPECLSAFMLRHPTVQVVIEEASADMIGQGLLAGSLDIGIAYQPPEPSELWFEPLYTEEMMLVVSHDHPLAQRKRVRMVELHRQNMVLLPKVFATRVMLEDCFRVAGAEPVVSAEMNTIAPMLGLVARTRLAAIIASNAIPARDDLRVIALESPTPVRTPGILWKRQAQQTAPVRSFAAILRKLALGKSLRAPAAGMHHPS